MCRSIKRLRRADGPATEQEVHEAALQFVRKISGSRIPSRANSAPFLAAVTEITAASHRLLRGMTSSSGAQAEGQRSVHS